MYIHDCKKYGSKYEVSDHSFPMRDKGSEHCRYCGELIISWNGGHIYTVKERSGPTKDFS